MDNKLLPNLYYHIYNHANGKDNLFLTPENYRFFLQQYAKHIYPVAYTLAYCLLPNHFHLLIRIRNEEELKINFPKTNLPGFKNLEGLVSSQFSNFFNSYTKAFNKSYNRRGSLFIKNFKRRLIADDAYFTRIIYYIHNNPVRHGFVKNIAGWPWTSYSTFLNNKPSKINRQEVLQWFGGMDGFEKFHR